jgi:malonate transporter and related proteins
MAWAIFHKLLAIFVTVGVGYIAGRMRWLGQPGPNDPARTLSNAAFYIFVPALLFRTTAKLDFAALPWRLVAAFFIPLVAVLLAVYFWQRRYAVRGALPVAGPSTRAIGAGFGNSVQLGIPIAAALYGEVGLGIHVSLVSLHALILLTVVTALVELDLARQRAQGADAVPLSRTLMHTARQTLVHPVVLPVVAGMVWNATGLGIPSIVDEALALLGSAVVPLCLVLIGLSLAYYGMPDALGGAVAVAAVKLLVVPAVVLVVARWGFGLHGVPLMVVVTMASLPVGSNALIFAQRYGALEAETTAAIVFSTLAFVVTAPAWLAVLGYVDR